MVKGKFLERDRKETQTLCDDNFLFTSSWKILSEKKISLYSFLNSSSSLSHSPT